MTEGAMVCANHPNRETTLRCNRCEKPICTRCAVHTPVGYRCRECVRGQQTVFETARPIDYPIAAVVSAVGVGLGTSVLSILSFWGLIVAPVAGGALAGIVRWAVRRRRSRRLALAAAQVSERADADPGTGGEVARRGGADADQVRTAMELILADRAVKLVLVNIFGGITRCDDVAKGVVEATSKLSRRVPLVVRLVGTNEEEGLQILRRAGISAHRIMVYAVKEAVAGVRA